MDADLEERVSATLAEGAPLTREDVQQLAAVPDILTLGMLADGVRAALCGRQVTYVRVATTAADKAGEEPPPAAGEIRMTGSAPSLRAACEAIGTLKRASGSTPVSGFSLADLVALPGGGSLGQTLRALKEAGLDMIGQAPLDRLDAPEAAIETMETAGFDRIRLTVERAAGPERVGLMLLARDLQRRFSSVVALNPLPMVVNPFRPTTGYEDVRIVALARLAAPGIRVVQVDWQRYGPKLAQVALTFGADDLDNVPAGDEAPDGARRSPLAEVRRNVEAAGFEPVERDGRFQLR